MVLYSMTLNDLEWLTENVLPHERYLATPNNPRRLLLSYMWVRCILYSYAHENDQQSNYFISVPFIVAIFLFNR